MFRKKYIIIIFLIVVGSIGGFIYKNKEKIYINSILATESYSYLPTEAKDKIKNVYENSGELILTEKNKEENVPYLNPEYVDYLSLSSTNKEKTTLIPNIYTIDYSFSHKFDSSICLYQLYKFFLYF